MNELERKLARLLNGHEEESNTPDFILAVFLADCLAAWEKANNAREQWYGVELRPGQMETDRCVRCVDLRGQEAPNRCPNCGLGDECSCQPLAVSDRDGDGSARPS